MMQWPSNMTLRPIETWPGVLTTNRQRSNFSAGWSDTLDLLRRELTQLKARDVVLQIAITESEFRIDGYPRANAKAQHPGVVLAIGESKVGPLMWPCDTFTTWQDNIRAIALSMEALRKMERYGVTKRGQQYTGWKAIEAPKTSMSHDDAMTVLRLESNSPTIGLSIRDHYQRARRNSHPDRHDGDRATWDRVEEAAKTLGLLQ